MTPVNWLRSMHARVRAMDPFRADVALAALFVVASVIEVFTVPSHGDNIPVTVAAGIAAQSALAWRRRDTRCSPPSCSRFRQRCRRWLGGFLTQDTTVHFLAAMLLLYSIGRYAERAGLPDRVPGS